MRKPQKGKCTIFSSKWENAGFILTMFEALKCINFNYLKFSLYHMKDLKFAIEFAVFLWFRSNSWSYFVLGSLE